MIAAVALAYLLQTALVAEVCAHDRPVLLALSPQDFDQNPQNGWRPLADKPECREVAADLLADYRTAHWGDLNPDELHTNYWHEGQLRASLGQIERATRLLMAGTSPTAHGDGRQDYALGTIAFLNGDQAGLQAARDRLAATPKPEGFEQTAARFKETYGRDLTWPMNLDVLDGLLACFGRPYAEAYGDCRTQ